MVRVVWAAGTPEAVALVSVQNGRVMDADRDGQMDT